MTLLIALPLGCVFAVTCRAEPQNIRLPMLEVPDDAGTATRLPRRQDRSALLSSPIELSDAADRSIAAREQAAWRRLSGSLCSGCGGAGRARRADYVDPIAVLNAKPVAWKPTVVASRAVQPPHAHRVQLAHRHRHKSKLYAYFSRVRYALLKWRRHHRHHRVRLVQR
jgi:hypothetical protein